MLWCGEPCLLGVGVCVLLPGALSDVSDVSTCGDVNVVMLVGEEFLEEVIEEWNSFLTPVASLLTTVLSLPEAMKVCEK